MTIKQICSPSADRFEIGHQTATMKSVVTTGNGGYEKLVYLDVPIPLLDEGEVLIQVLAAGMNNTDINTRLGWYSSSVTSGTDTIAIEASQPQVEGDGGWNESTPFPLIQGTDCCGRVVEVVNDTDQHLIGRRVLVRPCMRPSGFGSMDNIWMASDFDGAFAQYVKVPSSEVFALDCDWSDAELATIPCAYGTAENMVSRAKVTGSDRVLVTGASGGVGSAVVQLVKRRGARVVAIAAQSKFEQLERLGVDELVERGSDLPVLLGESCIDVVFDNVGGDDFGGLMKVLKRGGRYASSGAIAGPMVNFDMRDFYLKDLSLIGCTAWDEGVFADLIRYIEQGEIVPLVAKTFALENIREAQQEFLEKKHVGNFVLIPPATGGL